MSPEKSRERVTLECPECLSTLEGDGPGGFPCSCRNEACRLNGKMYADFTELAARPMTEERAAHTDPSVRVVNGLDGMSDTESALKEIAGDEQRAQENDGFVLTGNADWHAGEKHG